MGFAIIYIMLFHITTLNPNTRVSFFEMGNVGVELFVICSGIGIYYSLCKNANNLRVFFKNRLQRILVPYLVITIPFSLYSYSLGEITPTHVFYRIVGLTAFYEGNKWLWYISLALVCYILSPLLKKLVDSKQRLIYLIAIYLLCYITAIIWRKPEILLTRIPIFYIGLLLGKSIKENKECSIKVVYVILLLILFYLFAYYVKHVGVFGIRHYVFSRFSLNLLSIPLVLFVAYVADVVGDKVRKITEYCGTISFELYVVHLMPIFFFFKSFTNLWIYTGIIIVISMVASYILHRFSTYINSKIK